MKGLIIASLGLAPFVVGSWAVENADIEGGESDISPVGHFRGQDGLQGIVFQNLVTTTGTANEGDAAYTLECFCSEAAPGTTITAWPAASTQEWGPIEANTTSAVTRLAPDKNCTQRSFSAALSTPSTTLSDVSLETISESNVQIQSSPTGIPSPATPIPISPTDVGSTTGLASQAPLPTFKFATSQAQVVPEPPCTHSIYTRNNTVVLTDIPRFTISSALLTESFTGVTEATSAGLSSATGTKHWHGGIETAPAVSYAERLLMRKILWEYGVFVIFATFYVLA